MTLLCPLLCLCTTRHCCAAEERKAAEANAQRASFGVEQEKVRWDEQRKTIEYNKRQQKVRECAPAGRGPLGFVCVYVSA